MFSERDVILAMQLALITNVIPSMRLVCYRPGPGPKDYTFRIYFDVIPDKYEISLMDIVGFEFTCYFDASLIDDAFTECVYSEKALDELDTLEGILFKRKEIFKNGKWLPV